MLKRPERKVDKPFEKEEELKSKQQRLAELDALLNMDDKPEPELDEDIINRDDCEEEPAVRKPFMKKLEEMKVKAANMRDSGIRQVEQAAVLE